MMQLFKRKNKMGTDDDKSYLDPILLNEIEN